MVITINSIVTIVSMITNTTNNMVITNNTHFSWAKSDNRHDLEGSYVDRASHTPEHYKHDFEGCCFWSGRLV